MKSTYYKKLRLMGGSKEIPGRTTVPPTTAVILSDKNEKYNNNLLEFLKHFVCSTNRFIQGSYFW